MRTKRILALLLCAVMLASLGLPAAAEEAGDAAPEEGRIVRETIHVASVEDFRRLAGNCALDSYSAGLTVVLDNDLELGADTVAIPIFNGIFEGGGHTVSGLTLTGGSNLGLFRYVQSEGVIRDLNVEGSVQPDEGSDKVGGLVGSSYGSIENCSFRGVVNGRNYVGGLVGENYGSITGCTADAEVNGKRFTGGIVGYSEGLIRNCENRGAINTSVTEEMLSLDDLAAVTSNSLDLLNAEDENVVSDSGGIAGYSSGVLMDCVNHGTVGYQHFGYNVGGIAGRQSGHLAGCENDGSVLGRKDVAGIVGQMEPYLNLISEESLSEEIVTLNEYLNTASGDLAVMAAEMNSLREDAAADGSSMLEDADNLSGGGSISSADGSDAGGSISDGGGSISGGSISGGTISGGSGSGGTISGGSGGQSESNSIREDYNSFSERVSEAYGILSDSSNALSVDLGTANDQFSKVLMMMSDAVNGAANHEIFEDISGEMGLEDTEGRVSGNRNRGAVDGDSNVGGIIGSMGIEYEFDMEDKVVETLGVNGIVNKTYESKCVSSENVNYGSVTGRKDRIGGVVGSSETGLVLSCQGYGSVKSTDGSYVGGVAGFSGTTIRDSYVMCSLSGSKYVGGVAGYGSNITDCVSLVDLSSSNVCSGAIAGWADMAQEGAVDRNIYVHDTLGAIDGISYTDKAAPVSYEELIAREGIPDEFSFVTVSFIADGVVVENVTVPYGGTLDASKVPAVPAKPGYAGDWAAYRTDDLRFNETVEAVYILNQNTVAVETTREDSPMSVLLIEGDFQEEIHVSLTPYTQGGPEGVAVLETWELKVEGYTNPDGQGYTVRFLTPSVERGTELTLYRLEGDEWKRMDVGRSGSYVTFHAEDDDVIFAVTIREETRIQLMPWAAIAAGALFVIILIAVLIASGRKKKKAAAQSDEL